MTCELIEKGMEESITLEGRDFQNCDTMAIKSCINEFVRREEDADVLYDLLKCLMYSQATMDTEWDESHNDWVNTYTLIR